MDERSQDGKFDNIVAGVERFLGQHPNMAKRFVDIGLPDNIDVAQEISEAMDTLNWLNGDWDLRLIYDAVNIAAPRVYPAGDVSTDKEDSQT